MTVLAGFVHFVRVYVIVSIFCHCASKCTFCPCVS